MTSKKNSLAVRFQYRGSILQFKCLKYPSSSGVDQENLIRGGRDTIISLRIFFKIVRNITEKGGEGAAAVTPSPPHKSPDTL